MRFEIRAGGAVALLTGLAFLSGAVFVLGLVAGYEMGRQQETTQEQLSTVYPLPSPAEAAPSPSPAVAAASAPSPATGGAPASSSAAFGTSAGAPIKAASAASPLIAPPPSVSTPAPAVAETRPTPAAVAVGASAQPSASPGEREERRIASNPLPPHKRRGYNIQIQAVMDKSGADAMVAKLQRMGYQAYTMETQIGGQTWYRVRVGPYPTEAEAKAAEERLHQQYSHSSP
jgi:DedD protein